MVRVESGEHETKPFELKSNVTLELANGVTILASTNIADYATRGECPVFIYADHATNVAIVGKGTINGRGGGSRHVYHVQQVRDGLEHPAERVRKVLAVACAVCRRLPRCIL